MSKYLHFGQDLPNLRSPWKPEGRAAKEDLESLLEEVVVRASSR